MDPETGLRSSGFALMACTRAGCDHHIIDEPATPSPSRRGWIRRSARGSGRLRRNTGDRFLGGVAGGIARRLGIDVTIVRIAIVVMSLGGGSGLVAYMAAWLFLPADDEETSIGQRALHDKRVTALAVGIGGAVVAALLALRALGLGFAGGFVWSGAFAGFSLLIVWLQAAEADRESLRRIIGQVPSLPGLDGRSRRLAALRAGIGAVVVLASLAALAATKQNPGVIGRSVMAAAGILGGFALIFGPFWLRLGRELSEERRERLRSQERADLAAHLHDSVLQTLALIQRRAGDPREVVRLARAQERELRTWLFDGERAGRDSNPTLADAMYAIEAEAEATHGITVDTVVVGNAPIDDQIAALAAAAREAVMNAARWSQAPTVSLYAEVEDASVSVFVRDRGSGFDPGSVKTDRRGISESITGRMRRHGGTARIRSTPGKGTEVELSMPTRNGPLHNGPVRSGS